MGYWIFIQDTISSNFGLKCSPNKLFMQKPDRPNIHEEAAMSYQYMRGRVSGPAHLDKDKAAERSCETLNIMMGREILSIVRSMSHVVYRRGKGVT